VSSDPQVAASATRAGAQVEPDPGTGLNDAVRRGRDRLAVEGDTRVAVLLADLPALRARDLTTALDACGRHDAAYVPDAEGTGTVLLTAARPDLLKPAFGADSAQRHHEVAYREALDLPGLRRDVDLAASLSSAQALGLGPRTEAVLARGARAAGR
jgi:2-phospho-L-lactate guanylyltransferase